MTTNARDLEICRTKNELSVNATFHTILNLLTLYISLGCTEVLQTLRKRRPLTGLQFFEALTDD